MQVVGLITCERIVLGKGAKVLSFARVRRVLFTHNMEEEGEKQENEKEDERQDGMQRVEGRVVDNHIMSARGWDKMKCATHTNLEPMSMRH